MLGNWSTRCRHHGPILDHRSIAGVVMDITSRRNTVDAMHLCDKALASTSEAIIITDPNLPDNPIIYCNQGFEALTGRLHHQCLRNPAIARRQSASSSDWCATLSTAYVMRRDGRRSNLSSTVIAIILASGSSRQAPASVSVSLQDNDALAGRVR